MIRLTSFIPITTCSPRWFDRVKALGAAAAFDYRSPSCGSDILEYTQNSLGYALDCVSTSETMEICYKALGSKGGRYLALDQFPTRLHTRRSIRPDLILAHTPRLDNR
ncbi:hypothetical protein BJX99DRAFT_194647 [Aspergillus californicus]